MGSDGLKALAILLSVVGHALFLVYIHFLRLEPTGEIPVLLTQQNPGKIFFPVQYIVQTGASKELPPVAVSAQGPNETAAALTGLNMKRYRPTSELHTRPAPVDDWIIAKEALPPNTVASLVFTVWVSEGGVIDHYLIEDEAHQPKWVAAVLSQLKQTHMAPGTLNDNAVPSTMTVELIVDNTH